MSDAVARNASFSERERDLRERGRWEDLLRLYVEQAEITDPHPQRERLYQRAGEVARDQLRDPSRAEELFLKAFKVRRQFLPAIGALRGLLGSGPGLERVIGLELEVVKEPRRRAQLYSELGGLLKADKPELALEAFVNSLQANPKSRAALDAVEQLAKQLGSWRELVQAYRLAADGAEKPAQAAVFQFLAGTILDEHLKQDAEARVAFARALELKPQDQRIVAIMAKFFERVQAWEPLTTTLYHQLESADSPPEKARLLKRLAWVHETCLDQPERAQTLLLRALEAKKQDPPAIKQLLQLSERLGEPKGIATALELESELPGQSEHARAEKLERAAEQWDKAADGRRALTAIRASLQLRPRYPRALKVLERVTRRLGDWKEHARTLELERELLDPSRSPQERQAALSVLRRLAEVAEVRLKDEEQALSALAEIVRLDAGDAAARGRLEKLARSNQDWPRLIQALEARAASASDPADGAALLREVVLVKQTALQDAAGAIETCRALLELAPRDREGLGLLAELHKSQGDTAAEAAALTRRVEAEEEPALKAAALRQLADAQLRLEQPAKAAQLLDQALGLEPAGRGALAAWRLLTRVARTLQDDARVRDALAGWQRLETDPAALREIRIELAGIAERQGDVKGALAALEEILSEAPADPTALPALSRLLRREGRLQEAVERLEAASLVLEHDPPQAAAICRDLAHIYEAELRDRPRAREAWRRALLHDPQDVETFARFVALARSTKAWQAAFDALEEVAPQVRARELRLRIYREQAGLAASQLDKPALAVPKLEAILGESARDPEATRDLRRLYRRLERWPKLADLLEDAAAAGIAGLEPDDCRRELAALCRNQLNDLVRAAAALQGVLERSTDPADPAWEELLATWRGLKRHEDLVRSLERAASLGGEVDLRVQRLMEAAETSETLGRPREAARLLQLALEVAPRWRAVLAALARVQEAAGSLPEAVASLVEVAAVAREEGDAAGAATTHVHRGQLFETRLTDAPAAERAYREALEADPRCGAAHEALLQLLERAQAWERLESALGAAASVEEQLPRARHLVRRGEVLALELGRLDDALVAFDQAEEAAPRQALVRAARLRVLRGARRPELLAEALAARRAAQPAELSKEEERLLVREEAELRAFTLGQLEPARALLLAARKGATKDPGLLGSLLRVERRLALGKPLAEHLEEAAALETSLTRRADLLVEAGRILKARAGDPARAQQVLEQALQADKERLEAVRWLATIAREAGDMAALAGWTEREAHIEAEPRRKAVLLARLARLQRSKDPRGARVTYEKALVEDPENLAALRGLAPLLKAMKAWPELDKTLGTLARLEPDQRVKQERLVELGVVRLKQLKQAKEARQAFDRALQLDPTEVRALRGRARTLSPVKAAKELVATLQRLIQATPLVEERVKVGKRVAKLQLESLHDAEGAVAAAEEVLRQAPEDAEGWRLLRDAHLEARRWDRLAEAYQREARLVKDARLQEERLRQAALIWHHHVRDLPRAAAIYEEILGRGDPFVVAVEALPKLLLELERGREYEEVLKRIPGVVPRTRGAAEALLELGRREAGRGERAAAVEHFEAALREFPPLVAALDELAGLHRDDPPRLASVYERKRELLGLDPRGVKLRLQRAILLEEQLKDLDQAAEELRAAAAEVEALSLDTVPPHKRVPNAQAGRQAIFRRLAGITRRSARWPELAGVLGALASLAETPAAAAELLIEKAGVEREHLRDPHAAVTSLREAQARVPARPCAEQLVELLAEEERWAELVEALEALAGLIPEPPARAKVLARAATMLDQQLGRLEDATATWERVLELVPDYQVAFRALESLCSRTRDARTHARTLEQEAALLVAQEGREAAEKLVKVALRAVPLFESLKLTDKAIELLEVALERAPLDRRAHEQLERLHEASGDVSSLHALLERRAVTTPDTDEAVALRERLARLAEERLHEPGLAVGHWEKLLELRPGHGAALDALERLHESATSWEALLTVLHRRVAANPDVGAQATIFLRAGELLERRLERPDEAVRAYEEAHARIPEDARPLVGLERIHAARQELQPLVRVRLALRDLASDPRQRSQLALGVANARKQLGQREEALAALREALEELPHDHAVMALLRQELIDQEQFAEAAQILAREADVVRDRSTQVAVRMLRAALLRDRLGDVPEAIAELERARALAPQDKQPLLQLEPLYEHTGQVEQLVDVLEARAVLESEDALSADLLERAGALRSESDPEGAARAYERALRRSQLRPAPLDALVELYARLERWSEAARALHRRAELSQALGEDARPFLRGAALLEEQRLEAPALAAATLESLLDLVPEDREALGELARLRGALGEHAAHEDVLRRLADLSLGAERRALLLERAGILDEKLHRPAAAAECLRAALETLGPDARGEARTLAGLLMRCEEAADDPRGLLDATERALAAAHLEADREALLRQVARLASGACYRAERAIEATRELLRLHPKEMELRRALEELLLREGRAAELVEHLEEELGLHRRRGPEARVLLHRQADLLRGPLQDPAAAEQRYRELLELDPQDEAARQALEVLLRFQRKNEALAAHLAEKAARARTDLEAVTALVDEAAVHRERGDTAAARARLEAALNRARDGDVPPDVRVRTLRGLTHLYRHEGLWGELSGTLVLLAEEPSLPAVEKASARYELGVVLSRQLRRPDSAVEALEQALTLDPQQVPAARALAELYQSRNDLPRVVATWEREAAARVDRGRLVWLHNRIGAARHQLGQLAEAGKAFAEALRLDKGSLEAQRGLAAVSRELGDFPRLGVALEALAEMSPSPVDRLEARRELAHLCEEALGDLRRAVACYRHVLADAAEDLDAVRGLARGLRTLGDESGLVEVLEQELRLVSEEDRRRLLASEAAKLAEELGERALEPVLRREQLERALRHSRLVCELSPSDAEALGAYARVAEKLGAWEVLAEATVRLARAVDDPARAAWMLRRAAKIRALRLGDARGAVEAYREATRVNASDREAWQALEPLAGEVGDDALLLEVLERRAQLAKDGAQRAEVALKLGQLRAKLGDLPAAIDAFLLARDEGRGPLRAAALEQLEVCYRRAERWAELAQVLGDRAQAGAPNARELLLERARLLETRLDRPDLAVTTLHDLRRKTPEEQRIARELERLLSAQRRWEELAALYESEAAYRGARGYDALVLLGRLLRDQLDDPERASQALQRAVTLNPSGLEAVESLRELYTKTERWPELLDTLRLEIGLVKGRTRETRLRQAGHLAEERLGDLLTAARFYKEASALAPKDRNLLQDLARVQEARGDFQGLIATLEAILALGVAPVEAVQLHKHAGEVWAQRLFRPLDAVASYRQALALAPQDPDALAAMSELLRQLGAWDELAQTLERRLERVRGPEAVKLRLELARIHAERQGRPDAAIQASEQALAEDPRCLEAVELQVTVLRRWNQGGGQDAALATALKRLAALREGTARADVLVELAELLQRVQKPDAALSALREAAKADPAHARALERLSAQLEAAGLWEELLEVLGQAVPHVKEAFRQGELLTRQGDVLERQLGQPDRAEAIFRQALEQAPGHLPALRGLCRALWRRGLERLISEPAMAEQLSALEERAAKVELDPRERAAALTRAAELRRALGQWDLADQRYRAALTADLGCWEALASLAELTYAREAPGALAVLERVAASPDLVRDPERGAELMWARGQLLEQAGKVEAAAASWRRALELRPGHVSALLDMQRMLLDQQAWAAVRDVTGELVARVRCPELQAEHRLVLARAWAELGDADRAIELYRAGLARLPRRGDAQLRLGELLRAKNPEEAQRRFEWALAEEAAEVQVQARLALADLSERRSDIESAAGHLQAALELDGSHRAKSSRRLAEMLGRSERWSDAIHMLRRAVEWERVPSRRAELLSSLARVLRDRLQQRTLARRCFECALELNPHDRHNLDSLLRLLEADGDTHAMAHYLGYVAQAARQKGAGDEVALRLRRAELLLCLQKKPDAAEELEQVLRLEPGHSGAQASLAQLYLELGEIGALERAQRTLLQQDPLNVACYRSLAEGWRAGGRKEEYALALQALSVLRATSEEEERKVKEQLQTPAAVGRKLKDEDFAADLVHPDCQGPLLTLMQQVGELLLRQLPDDLKNYGLGGFFSAKPFGPEGDAFPEHRLVKQVCDLLGLTALDVYWQPTMKTPDPVIGHGKTSSLILCPEAFAGLDEGGKLFVLARALAPLKMGLEVFRAVPADMARRLVLGALKGLDPARRFPGDDDKLVRAVAKALGRQPELQAPLAEAQQALWAAREQLPVEGFTRGVTLTAARAGMLAAGGPLPAARALISTNLALRGRLPERTEERVKALRDLPELKDMVAWSVSEAYWRVRRKVFLPPTRRAR